MTTWTIQKGWRQVELCIKKETFAHHLLLELIKTGLDVEVKTKNNLQCIAVLPGIGCYDGSSDSESNSDSDDEVCAPLNANVPQFDLCGRPLQSQHEAEWGGQNTIWLQTQKTSLLIILLTAWAAQPIGVRWKITHRGHQDEVDTILIKGLSQFQIDMHMQIRNWKDGAGVLMVRPSAAPHQISEWHLEGWFQGDHGAHKRSLVSKSSVPSGQHLAKHKKEAILPHREWLISKLQTWATPWSQPLITSPRPMRNLKGEPRSREESNLEPSSSVPVEQWQALHPFEKNPT